MSAYGDDAKKASAIVLYRIKACKYNNIETRVYGFRGCILWRGTRALFKQDYASSGPELPGMSYKSPKKSR